MRCSPNLYNIYVSVYVPALFPHSSSVISPLHDLTYTAFSCGCDSTSGIPQEARPVSNYLEVSQDYTGSYNRTR